MVVVIKVVDFWTDFTSTFRLNHMYVGHMVSKKCILFNISLKSKIILY